MVVPLNQKIELYSKIEHAIYASVSRLKDPHESDYIAALIRSLPGDLQNILNGYMPGKFRVGGCFLHQKPFAKFCDPSIPGKSPEIGDLLIVYKEVHTTDIRYNALLLQAKKTKNIYRARVSSRDMHQLTLYTKWPIFEYTEASLKGEIRDITPKTITSGAQYLLIDERKSYHPLCPAPSFWCAMPQRVLSASNTLALQIVKFLEFQVGRPFVENPTRKDWSQMIWDLLHISATSKFNRQRSGHTDQPRSYGDIFNQLLESNGGQEIYDSPEGGVSVLCIEGRVEQERPR